MNAKNYFAGAATLLALFINVPANAAEIVVDTPFADIGGEYEPFRDNVPPLEDSYLEPETDKDSQQKNSKSKKKIKYQQARFVKLTSDDLYVYYLDKQSVKWQRVPYLANEYMADVWIRMIELKPDTSDLPDDLAAYVNDTRSGEVETERENGVQLNPVDVEVLSHKKYFLEHYYLRPQRKQIQFLCELEVVGHPQNTISEREYEYKNWENLVPGSIESIIYAKVLKEIGTSKSTERGHMTFADMLDEYARIALN